jgi:hypothetical protein
MKTPIESCGNTTDLMLEVFDIPVTFHRCLVPVAGGVTQALMLSQAIWTTQTLEPAAGGWFMRSQAQWTQETGLSRWEQETARRALRRAGLLEERHMGLPAKLWFRVCADVLMHALQESIAQPSRSQEERCQ